MIFLTPHIVAEPMQLASLTAGETTKVQVLPGSYTEDDMNAYLDNLPNRIGLTNKIDEPKKDKKKK